jgi:hypothetical protein
LVWAEEDHYLEWSVLEQAEILWLDVLEIDKDEIRSH